MNDELLVWDEDISLQDIEQLPDHLKNNKNVQSLGFSRNNLGDDGAKAILEALQTNTTLTYLSLEYNKISKSLMDEIQQKINQNTELKNGQ